MFPTILFNQIHFIKKKRKNGNLYTIIIKKTIKFAELINLCIINKNKKL